MGATTQAVLFIIENTKYDIERFFWLSKEQRRHSETNKVDTGKSVILAMLESLNCPFLDPEWMRDMSSAFQDTSVFKRNGIIVKNGRGESDLDMTEYEEGHGYGMLKQHTCYSVEA